MPVFYVCLGARFPVVLLTIVKIARRKLGSTNRVAERLDFSHRPIFLDVTGIFGLLGEEDEKQTVSQLESYNTVQEKGKEGDCRQGVGGGGATDKKRKRGKSHQQGWMQTICMAYFVNIEGESKVTRDPHMCGMVLVHINAGVFSYQACNCKHVHYGIQCLYSLLKYTHAKCTPNF